MHIADTLGIAATYNNVLCDVNDTLPIINFLLAQEDEKHRQQGVS